MKDFIFKQFRLQQFPGVMPLTMDPLLLSSVIHLPGKSVVLDIGTGSGVIPLILAQRFPDSRIHGIDIEPESVMAARANFKASPFNDRLSTGEIDLFSWKTQERFDVIVSNPPYYSGGLLPRSGHLRRSKHDIDFSWEAFFQKAAELSDTHTLLYVIFPVNIWDRLRLNAVSEGWYLQHLYRWESIEKGSAERFIACWGRTTPVLDLQDLEALYEGTRLKAAEIRAMTRDLYIWG